MCSYDETEHGISSFPKIDEEQLIKNLKTLTIISLQLVASGQKSCQWNQKQWTGFCIYFLFIPYTVRIN